MRQLLPVLVLSLASSSFAQDACPVTDTKNWSTHESNRETKGPLMHIVERMKYAEVYFFVEREGVTFFWCFAIKPNTTVQSITLVTTKGTYLSEDVFFTMPDPTFKIMPGPVASPEYNSKRVNGEIRIVAFAKFPSAPQGDLISWSVEP